MFRRQSVAVDLGTSMTRIFVRGRGVALLEPSVVALNQETNEVVAVGREAMPERVSERDTRVPANVISVRPLRDGIVGDYGLAEKMLATFVSRVVDGLGSKPDIVLCLPSSLAEAEGRTVLEATREVAREVSLLEEPLAAALGAGLDVDEAAGAMLVHIGSSVTHIAVVGGGRVVASESLRVAGDAFDEAIVRTVRHKANLLIGEQTAEAVKLELGAATNVDINPDRHTETERTKAVRGRDLTTGIPKTVAINAEDVAEALRDPLRKIVSGVRRVLEAIPPERAAKVVDRGIVLTGGGALLRNLDDFLQQQTGLPVTLAAEPADCVILGLGRALDLPDLRALSTSEKG